MTSFTLSNQNISAYHEFGYLLHLELQSFHEPHAASWRWLPFFRHLLTGCESDQGLTQSDTYRYGLLMMPRMQPVSGKDVQPSAHQRH